MNGSFPQFGNRAASAPAPNSLFAESDLDDFADFGAWTADIMQLERSRGPGWVTSYGNPQANRLTTLDRPASSGCPGCQTVLFVLDLGSTRTGRFRAERPREVLDSVLTQTAWTVMASASRLQPRKKRGS